jgi:hypothetical protein
MARLASAETPLAQPLRNPQRLTNHCSDAMTPVYICNLKRGSFAERSGDNGEKEAL